MSASLILTEIADLLRSQTAAVVAGNYEAILQGANRHEELLRMLADAPIECSPDDLRALVATVDEEKAKLQGLLNGEAARVDFLMRLIIGGRHDNGSGYPGADGSPSTDARMINRRA